MLPAPDGEVEVKGGETEFITHWSPASSLKITVLANAQKLYKQMIAMSMVVIVE